MTDNGKITWTNEKRRLSELIPWPRNPRQIKTDQAKRLVQSFDQFGQVETIAIGPGNEVYNGHQRLNVLADKYGRDYEVECRVASRALAEKEREKLTVFLHKGAAGEWDFDTLANEFELDDLLEWGFDKKELDLDLWLPEPPDDPGAQMDKAEELREKWGVETGQLWQLGEHRLICGDCTDRAVVERVMGEEKADMIETDPPYGVDYNGQTDSMFYGKDKQGTPRTRITGDLSLEDAVELANASLSLVHSPIIFLWCAPQYHDSAKEILVVAGYEIFSVIVWNKNHANFGAMGARYKPKFEMAVVGKRGNIPWYGPDNEVTVWDIDRAASNEFHPTQKPPELFERAINNHTKLSDVIYDPFLGSGTTLVACERLGRKCRACEISAAYCAVAIQRWVDMTGGTPVLVELDGKMSK